MCKDDSAPAGRCGICGDEIDRLYWWVEGAPVCEYCFAEAVNSLLRQQVLEEVQPWYRQPAALGWLFAGSLAVAIAFILVSLAAAGFVQ